MRRYRLDFHELRAFAALVLLVAPSLWLGMPEELSNINTPTFAQTTLPTSVHFPEFSRGYNVQPAQPMRSKYRLTAGPTEAHFYPTSFPDFKIRARFIGSNPNSEMHVTSAPGMETVSPSSWASDLGNPTQVTYRHIYPGVHLVYFGTNQEYRFGFQILSGVDPNLIRISFEGAKSIRLDPEGRLLLSNPAGEVRYRAPIVYQQKRMFPIQAKYFLDASSHVGIRLSPRDHSQPLFVEASMEPFVRAK
ncbi:MAG: hypothetical protein HY537_06795 [Deltaproteobacteria bacterium]|nr:hypothetical protein [Deltaproteobacteria bacterium]